MDADEIAADPGRSFLLPTADAVAQAFTAEGVVGSLYEEYEQRGEQVAMAEAVRNAFARSRNLMWRQEQAWVNPWPIFCRRPSLPEITVS
ncbi:hypothetical protein, partial [Adlercreutzia sp. DFI.6.23]|uniref:hypothetical protein n=1 Tax=Adlercreutzia sp. DFI.6.23 TaxID=2963705 RepID=UPI00210DF853